MKRTIKKAIAVLLTLAIVMSVVSIAAFAVDEDSIVNALSNTPLASFITVIKDFIAVIKEAVDFINNGMPGLPFGDKA